MFSTRFTRLILAGTLAFILSAYSLVFLFLSSACLANVAMLVFLHEKMRGLLKRARESVWRWLTLTNADEGDDDANALAEAVEELAWLHFPGRPGLGGLPLVFWDTLREASPFFFYVCTTPSQSWREMATWTILLEQPVVIFTPLLSALHRFFPRPSRSGPFPYNLRQELLQQIFEFAVLEDAGTLNTFPLVSRNWCMASLGRHWSYISYTADTPFMSLDDFVEKIECLLVRSGSSSLKIRINFRYWGTLANARRILQLLDSDLHRCSSFAICVPEGNWLPMLAPHCRSLSGRLRTFMLSLDPLPLEEVPPPVILLDGNYPRLSSIVLEHITSNCISLNVESPRLLSLDIARNMRYSWHQYTNLDWFHYVQLVNRVSQSLESIRLEAVAGVLPIQNDWQRIPLLQVSRVMLSEISDIDAVSFLDFFAIPNVRDLEINVSLGGEHEAIQRIVDRFVQGRFAALRRLSLAAVAVDEPIITELLDAWVEVPLANGRHVRRMVVDRLGALVIRS